MTVVRCGRVDPPDFDALYAADADPWRVESSWYERRKRSVLMASLPREQYASAWEPGCGTGVTTEALASRVRSLVSSDLSGVAVDAARQRCASLPHVRCVVSALPDVPFEGVVDLIVAAEFLYYVSDLDSALAAVWSRLAPGGHLVVMHWAHHPHDAFRSGPATQASLASHAEGSGAVRRVAHVDADFLLDVYEAQA
jgi:predicted TPR repeat methyltransferase